MTDRFALDAHVALVTEAKLHLGIVAPSLRGQLARYLDLGQQPDSLLCSVLDSDDFAIVEAEHVPMTGLFWWLARFAPPECHGTRERRIAWQVRVAAMVAGEDDEVENLVRDTERPGAPESEAAE
jgi:hypothetical protein